MINILQRKKSERPTHWPTLNTVIMVEDTLKKINESVISVAELKRKLPRKVNHITLITILEYLEKSGKIVTGLKGITWIYNENSKLKKEILEGLEL
jgi:hypothetical protein